ncbi:uncharacterized protein LOC144545483 [Carex rostrata]
MIHSTTFTVGEHDWRILCYLDGYKQESSDCISVFLQYCPKSDEKARVKFTLSLLDHATGAAQNRPCYTSVQLFSSSHIDWGWKKFIRRNVLEASSCLRNDSLTIICNVTIIGEPQTYNSRVPPIVKPSILYKQLGTLLSVEKGSDINFDVDGRNFPAHRSVVAASSPVFRAHISGLMKEPKKQSIKITDIKAPVFEAILLYIYTDNLPEIETLTDTGMAQHLLVAADRFALDKLRRNCEKKLCEGLDVRNVCTALALADQHSLSTLKSACLQYLSSPKALLSSMATDGFIHMFSFGVQPIYVFGFSPPQSQPLLDIFLAELWRPTSTAFNDKSVFGKFSFPLLPEDSQQMNILEVIPWLQKQTTNRTPPWSSVSCVGTSTGVHHFEICNYTLTKGRGIGKNILSTTFTVGDHDWRISCYLDGDKQESSDYISVYLLYYPKSDEKVRVKFTLSFLDHATGAAQHRPGYTSVQLFSSTSQGLGFSNFIRKNELEKSSCLRNDSLTIICILTIIEEPKTYDSRVSLKFNPSILYKRLATLLSIEMVAQFGFMVADIYFQVDGQYFSAHRSVVAASSPVFHAHISNLMKEAKEQPIKITDIEAPVFAALILFIYTDHLPEIQIHTDTGMAQHLLVVADRFSLYKLRRYCEKKLCEGLNVNNVCTVLALANQHSLSTLKSACLQYLSSPKSLLSSMATDEFIHSG